VRHCPLSVAHVAQALAQCLEIVEPGLVNFRVVAAQDDGVLIVAEDAAFKLAGYGHALPSWVSGALMSLSHFYRARDRDAKGSGRRDHRHAKISHGIVCFLIA
jgi:hypothetical protein